MATTLTKLRAFSLRNVNNWILRSRPKQNGTSHQFFCTTSTVKPQPTEQNPVQTSSSHLQKKDGVLKDQSPTQEESRWRRLKRLRREWYRGADPPNRPKLTWDKNRTYSLKEALENVREASFAKFDESIELVIRLNIDPRQAEHNLRGTVTPPHGTGRDDKIVVFAPDHSDLYEAAKKAGVYKIGFDDLFDKIKETKAKCLKGATVCLTTRENIPRIAGRLGRILGPKGFLPSEKAGSIVTGDGVEELTANIADFVKGKIYYRIDPASTLHMNVGKLSFDDEELEENIIFTLKEIIRRRPADVRKKFVLKTTICSTMGPGIQINAENVLRQSHRMQVEEIEKQQQPT